MPSKPWWQKGLEGLDLMKFDTPPGEEGEVNPALATSAPAGSPAPAPPAFPKSASPVPLAPGGPTSAETNILTTDFPDIYSRNGVVGNPQIDPILTAYSQMAGPLKGEGLITAMKAMMQGMNVPEAAVIETLGKRLAVLSQTLTEENAKATDRKTQRDQALATLKTKVEARIAELQDEIAKLQKMFGEKEKEIADADAGDFGSMKAFQVKVATEQQRIEALKTFLEGGVK